MYKILCLQIFFISKGYLTTFITNIIWFDKVWDVRWIDTMTDNYAWQDDTGPTDVKFEILMQIANTYTIRTIFLFSANSLHFSSLYFKVQNKGSHPPPLRLKNFQKNMAYGENHYQSLYEKTAKVFSTLASESIFLCPHHISCTRRWKRRNFYCF